MGELLASFERASHAIALHLDAAGEELGITQAEAHVLAQVKRRGPTPIGTLHREFGHKRSTLTNVVDRLERRGFVRRELNPRDRRSFVVYLTDDGALAARRVVALLDDLEGRVTAHLDERDLEGIALAVRALEAGARRLGGQPPP
jgi:DNA-binding MarR family transcriptional regulator